jgi:CubicO group peptidase (beta-lactamase class C family)
MRSCPPFAVLVLALSLPLRAEAPAPPDVTGLWIARSRFGPDVQGALTVRRAGDSVRADIAGRSVRVRVEGARFTVELPADEGRFRGEARGSSIVGHWIQARMASNGMSFATPVTLAPVGRDTWRGIVAPVEDALTFYLPLARDASGSLTAYLRNPERNAGRFIDVRSAVFAADRVTLLGAPAPDGTPRVMAEGPWDAENATFSLSLRGSTYDFHRATAAEESRFRASGGRTAPYVYAPPDADDDGWPVASLEDVGLSRAALARFVQKLADTPEDSVHAQQVHGLLIARHGKLVLEEYFHGAHRGELHDTRSAAKSLTSLLTGAAILHGAPLRLDTPVYASMGREAADPRARALAVEHLLTMSSGLDCDDADPDSPGAEDTMQQQSAQPDWYRYTLDLKMVRNPGEKAVYCSTNPNLMGGVLARATGRWLPDLFHEQLAEPLQIQRYALGLTPTGEAYMGGGARFAPRDFMKLGQVLLDGGRWKGRQVVSADWARRSIAPAQALQGRQYGFLWWLDSYPFRGRKVGAFYAAGNGGQIVMGVPELDLLIAFYGGNYSDAVALVPQREYVPDDILPAVVD